MDVYGRTLVGDSLGFHILFALLGVGLPLMVLIAEGIGIWSHDKDWLGTAQRWTKALVILFVAGAVSGTLISIQFSAVWPKFMTIAGQVVGLSFFLEGFAFLIEVLFLSAYVLMWPRIGGTWKHWWLGVPIMLASLTSAVFITDVNAWMNAPQGFKLVNGQPVDINAWKAVLNPAAFTEITHSTIAYYTTTAAVLAAWYAYRAVRRRQLDKHAKQLIVVLTALVLGFSLLLGLTGDASGKYLAKYEPLKLAAAEGLFKSTSNAPLQVGGIVSGDKLHGAITIPYALSFLAFDNIHAVVSGLNIASPALWPPLVIHYFFDSMAIIGTLLVAIPALFLLVWWRKAKLAWSRPMLWLLVLGGILAPLAVEFGWMLTEIGRQPYAIKGILTTANAITTSQAMIQAAALFPLAYLVLLGLTGFLLLRPGRKALA